MDPTTKSAHEWAYRTYRGYAQAVEHAKDLADQGHYRSARQSLRATHHNVADTCVGYMHEHELTRAGRDHVRHCLNKVNDLIAAAGFYITDKEVSNEINS